jgi:hypothetical protein
VLHAGNANLRGLVEIHPSKKIKIGNEIYKIENINLSYVYERGVAHTDKNATSIS